MCSVLLASDDFGYTTQAGWQHSRSGYSSHRANRAARPTVARSDPGCARKCHQQRQCRPQTVHAASHRLHLRRNCKLQLDPSCLIILHLHSFFSFIKTCLCLPCRTPVFLPPSPMKSLPPWFKVPARRSKSRFCFFFFVSLRSRFYLLFLSQGVRLAAIKALNNSLEFIKENFEREGERNFIMQVVCEATQSESSDVQIAAFECLVRIMQLYYDKMRYYMEKALFGVSVFCFGMVLI